MFSGAVICAAIILLVLLVISITTTTKNRFLTKQLKGLEELKTSFLNYKKESENFLSELKELTFIQKNTILNQKSDLDNLTKAHVQLKDRTGRVESQKKSSEVKLGLMAENFMPFIRDYPYDHKKFRFLANPVDGLQVTDDAVIFIEFKTGAARLSKSQRAIKEMVSKGNVRFETFRVNEQGTSLKIESNMEDSDESKTGE